MMSKYVGTYNFSASDNFMHGRDRFKENADIMNALLTEPKVGVVIEEPYICASRGRPIDNPNSRKPGQEMKQRLEINTSGCSNCLTTVQKDNWVIEPCVLTKQRNEYGKQIRKDYENGLVSEKISNMNDLVPRADGLSNTLTTVQKDNYVIVHRNTEENDNR